MLRKLHHATVVSDEGAQMHITHVCGLTDEGATQLRYTPDSPSFDTSLNGRFSPLPPLPSAPGEAQAAPVEEGVPPGGAEPEPEPES